MRNSTLHINQLKHHAQNANCDAIIRRMFAYSEKSGTAMIVKRNGTVISDKEFQCAA